MLDNKVLDPPFDDDSPAYRSGDLAVSKILDCTTAISELSEQGKSQAEQMMIDTHMAPDSETATAMLQAQAAIDDIFASAQSGTSEERIEARSNLSWLFLEKTFWTQKITHHDVS